MIETYWLLPTFVGGLLAGFGFGIYVVNKGINSALATAHGW